jgi:ribose-phosphate pyrophosphokinase
VGIEPTRQRHWILNPARLPIPPPRLILDCKNRNYFHFPPKKNDIYIFSTQLISKFAPRLIKPLKINTLSMSYQVPEPKIFACTQSTHLAERIAKSFGSDLGKVMFSRYSDGEFQPSFEESVRGARVFIVGSTNPSSENLMEMLLMLDAAKRASARHITAVMPYFGWARQDRKDKPRVPIAAKLVAKMLEVAGATRIITMDLHADQIQGFFEKPVDHLFASTLFLPYLRNLNLDNLTIASPDMGGSKRAYAYSKALECDVVICYKQREKANIISHMELIGDVKGKNVVLVDDMVDTAGTLTKAADLMMERGALSVRAITTHALLSGDAYEKIEKSQLLELIVTDSIPLKKESNKVNVLSCAELFSDVMQRVHQNTSISSKFLM